MSAEGRAIAAAMLLAAASCTKADPEACVRRLTVTAKRLASLPADFTPLPTPPGAVLPEVPRAPVVKEAGTVLAFTGSGLELDGYPVSAAEVGSKLARLAELRAKVGSMEPTRIYLALDGAASVQAVLPAICGASAHGEARLLVRSAGAPPPVITEPPPWLAAELEAIRKATDTGEKARRISEAFSRAMGSCQPLQKKIEALATVDPASKNTELRRALLEGLEGCSCQADVDALEALVLRLLGDPPPAYALPASLTCEGSAAGVALPAGATAIDLARALVDRTGPQRIQIAGQR